MRSLVDFVFSVSWKRSRRHNTRCAFSRCKSHDLHFAKHGGWDQERNGKQNKLPAILTPFWHAESERELGWWCCQLANGPSDEESCCSWNWFQNRRRSGQKSLQVNQCGSRCMCGQISHACRNSTSCFWTGKIIQIPQKFKMDLKESTHYSNSEA